MLQLLLGNVSDVTSCNRRQGWLKFISGKSQDDYKSAIINARDVWHETHRGLPYGAPVPYRARYFDVDWAKKAKSLVTPAPVGFRYCCQQSKSNLKAKDIFVVQYDVVLRLICVELYRGLDVVLRLVYVELYPGLESSADQIAWETKQGDAGGQGGSRDRGAVACGRCAESYSRSPCLDYL